MEDIEKLRESFEEEWFERHWGYNLIGDNRELYTEDRREDIASWWIEKIKELDERYDTVIFGWKKLVEDLKALNQKREEEIIQQIDWLIPITGDLEKYVEVVKTGNMDSMFDYGFNKCKERLLALLKGEETK
jgi:hypothetical protein